MEPNKMPLPPKEIRRMPPPPPRPMAPKAENVQIGAETRPIAPQMQPVQPVQQPNQSDIKTPVNVEDKKIKKEKKNDDLENIGLVDVRQNKKVDGKAMFYYVGIFASLAVIAVLLFLILK